MTDKYIHNVCSCGCSELIVPHDIDLEQLILRCLIPQDKSI